MIKAGALFYAIAISLVISIICSSYIIFAHFNRLNSLFLDQNQKLIVNANSGLNLLLSNSSNFVAGKRHSIDLFSEQKDSVILERKQWGVYELAISMAFSKKNACCIAAIIGKSMNKDEGFALYLADNQRPLSLCGNTILNGTCFVPKSGIKRSYMEGQNFVGKINGKQSESSSNLPVVKKSVTEFNMIYFNDLKAETDSLVSYENDLKTNSLIHSFKDLTLLLKSKSEILLDKKVLKGNIRIVSQESVFISASSVLEDVIIYAPKIIVENGFKGSMQLIASDGIEIGKDCHLNYPSSLSIINNNKTSSKANIVMKENSTLKGVVFAYQIDQAVNNSNITVNFEKNTQITGDVYVVGNVSLKGIIHGSMTCQKFILQTPSTLYENHLLNAVIDYSKLPNHFTSAAIINGESNNSIVKWAN